MAKDQPLAEMSTDELIKNQKRITFMTSILGGMLILLLGLTIQTWINNGRSPLIAVPFALAPIVVINIKKINAIKQELKSRGI
ncbi:redox-active disulfide protein 2 [Sphingobacterium oryzagri]|uniref:Redox-active disulfide protein 2 n=1 Tax=Sphingobacterium oryzagri TaxID=3025669 RepID=A0ABY7WNU5_9SPHI|nr:redox-active disulfide protein 2 [Sphingobacterium sp. KACC 22765]WDF70710.1 redox-active disulfide protein 2 [Sphingobacterium sp. KACC 22765]